MGSLVTPMLALNDCAAAIEFYKVAFHAVEEGERYPYEGKIGHAELRIGDSKIMVADQFPEFNVSPTTLGGTAVILHLEVSDVDETSRRAVEAGAELVRPPADQEYGRTCVLKDPFGHKWMLNGPAN
jgi:PhnB protein